jgi:hypothetical protein
VKRILIALVLGALLTLSAASVAVAKVTGIGHVDVEVIPDSGLTLTVIDQGSRLSARLLAIDAVFYPDSFGAEGVWQIPDVNYLIADGDGYYLSYF